jgi:predicted acyl esterase
MTPGHLSQIPLTLSILSLATAVLPLDTTRAQCGVRDKQQECSPASRSEIPDDFRPAVGSFDFTRREEQIPMRDGVTLHTVIVIPKTSQKAPILLTRTPYNADQITNSKPSSHMEVALENGLDNPSDVFIEGGYIRVVQDIRGKFGSGGNFVMNCPLRGPQNSSLVDESTDAYDTVDWLVKNLPESNGRVGIIGTSYDGFLSLMAAIHPHPALKVAIAQNRMVDGWMGDDWFHYGAFRQPNAEFIYTEESTHDSSNRWWTNDYDTYEAFLDVGSAGKLGKSHGLDQLGFLAKDTRPRQLRQILARPGR